MLDLYKNIKKLRIEQGLSQEALAKLTGYTDRSSIAKIEKGEVDLQQSKIKVFAEALGTTPTDLMGWTDKPREFFYDKIYEFHLRDLLNTIRDDFGEVPHNILVTSSKLNDKNQLQLLNYAENLLSLQSMENELLAAHERAETEQNPDGKKHDIDIMKDDSEWE